MRVTLALEELVTGLHECGVPTNLHDGLLRYVRQGIPTGSFLHAVLCNDLGAACRRGDPATVRCLPEIVRFLDGYVPDQAWGSEDRVKAWTLREEVDYTAVCDDCMTPGRVPNRCDHIAKDEEE
jgi:hypothetical protein